MPQKVTPALEIKERVGEYRDSERNFTTAEGVKPRQRDRKQQYNV